MDNDKQAIVVGLGAGLGGFIGFVRIFLSLKNKSFYRFDRLDNYLLYLLANILWLVS
jgi:hypothetical protein